MENYSIVLFILAIMIVLSALAEKIRLPWLVRMLKNKVDTKALQEA